MPPWTPLATARPAMGRSTRSGSENRQKTRAVLVRLEEGCEAALREHASRTGLTPAALVRQLIDKELADGGRFAPLAAAPLPGANTVDPNLTQLWRPMAHTAGLLVKIAKLLREQRNRELQAQAESTLKECRRVLAEVARLAGRAQP